MNNTVTSRSYECPNGCVDGACVNAIAPTTITCTAFSYSAWSTCTNGQQTRTVSASYPSGCTGGNPVLSQPCTVTPSTTPTPICNDSDGGSNPYIKGTTNLGTNIKPDTCYGSTLNEYYCALDDGVSVLDNDDTECPNGCVNGACVNVTTQTKNLTTQTNLTTSTLICNDSDGGNYAYMKGTTSLGTNIKPDTCYGSTLNEYYCALDDGVSVLDNDDTECPNGCVNGACVNVTTPKVVTNNNSTTLKNVSSCEELYEQGGLLFTQIGKYPIIGGKNVPPQSVESGFFKGSERGHSIFYYALGEKANPDAVLTVKYSYVSPSSLKFSDYQRLEVLLNDSIYDLKNYINGQYYSFFMTGKTDLRSALVYTKDNFLVEVFLNSNKTDLNTDVANVAIQRYLDVCPSDVKEACLSKWSVSIEPLTCPDSGVQTKTFTDLNNCQTPIEKQINCNVGDCGGCSVDGNCYILGYRLDNSYCDLRGLVAQKADSAKCNNNFECSSNICAGGSCMNEGMWANFLNWFKSIFGVGLVKSLGGSYGF